MLQTLSQVAKKFNASDITWGVGASMLLNQLGLVEEPNDIDIVVALHDIEKAVDMLSGMGEKKTCDANANYSTECFYEYVINGVDLDVMAGFAINHHSGVFHYPFDRHSISMHKEIHGVMIPFTSPEDWFVIYQLIPNREAKVNMIERYVYRNGIKHPFRLKRLLKENLPKGVENRVKKMLSV